MIDGTHTTWPAVSSYLLLRQPEWRGACFLRRSSQGWAILLSWDSISRAHCRTGFYRILAWHRRCCVKKEVLDVVGVVLKLLVLFDIRLLHFLMEYNSNNKYRTSKEAFLPSDKISVGRILILKPLSHTVRMIRLTHLPNQMISTWDISTPRHDKAQEYNEEN